jgi:DNA-binding beta-propeller fold protein YncE
MLMKSLRITGLILAIALAPSFAKAEYKIIDRVKVGDGGFDYAAYNPATNQVLMARTDYTTVIDVKTHKVSELKNAIRAHITLPVPGTTLAVLPQRRGSINDGEKGTVRIVDLANDTVVADLPGGVNPDSAAYDPFTRYVWIANQISAQMSVVDAVGKKIVKLIDVGGKLEFVASDSAGKVFVVDESPLPNTNIAVLDAKAYTAAPNRYPLQGCNEATGLAYVPPSKLLVASCKNEMAKFLDAATGKEVASIKIGKGPDAVIYDAKRQLVFIPCGIDGVLEVISVADPAKIAVVQHLPTQQGSRTGTIDPETGRLYLMASKADPAGAPPGGGPIPRLAGSFEVLVISP